MIPAHVLAAPVYEGITYVHKHTSSKTPSVPQHHQDPHQSINSLFSSSHIFQLLARLQPPRAQPTTAPPSTTPPSTRIPHSLLLGLLPVLNLPGLAGFLTFSFPFPLKRNACNNLPHHPPPLVLFTERNASSLLAPVTYTATHTPQTQVSRFTLLPSLLSLHQFCSVIFSSPSFF